MFSFLLEGTSFVAKLVADVVLLRHSFRLLPSMQANSVPMYLSRNRGSPLFHGWVRNHPAARKPVDIYPDPARAKTGDRGSAARHSSVRDIDLEWTIGDLQDMGSSPTGRTGELQ